MPTLTNAEIDELIKDLIVGNVATDAPVAAPEILRAKNDAYASVWEISGGGITTAASATLWTSAEVATGKVAGVIAGVKEILHLFASSTSGSTGQASGDNELDRKELSYIQWLRQSSLTGTYSRPKVYAVTRMATATAADVGKLQLDYWPSLTGFYFPAIYLPQFVPLDTDAADKPDVNDLESYDIAYMAAADLAQRIGRAELVPGILMKISAATQLALDRKLQALMSGDQER